ncbi:MAG: glycosyltransferase family 4 protein [Desulfobacteraceae bacterium]|nr:glycosyltransferase family 4 protein [Desulfobacteraceae bacterium]
MAWKSVLQLPLISPPRCLKKLRLEHACRGSIFHGPNYFIPDYADIGIATVHDLSIFKFPETHPAERIRQFEREFNRTLDRASHLITDSEAIRMEVIDSLNWPEDRITAVPLGVSSEFGPMPYGALQPCMRKYGLTEGGYTLCVSTLEPRKRIDKLLLAYQALPQDLRTRFPLILAGSTGWLSEALQERIELYSRQGWVCYLGFVPESDLPALYAGARLFAFPSVYEGFGLPVLEAMASGIPVVTSNCSSLPEITQGAALLADPDNVDELGQFIVKGLCDDGWRSTARSGGLSVAETCTWGKCVEQTVRVYEYVAERHSLFKRSSQRPSTRTT